ncbi:MAG: hypothetical protein HN855_08620 [Anaerolineae bacterium]|jgi:hypothetical protein|nr:hypothetical protein [Anaerolineae bacterium]MBT7071681.1 hypothetical protein [Anaerolineae bacterium]MBT7325207.1 hypothetical protein [Anaerolineae bacterium]
MDKKKLFQHKGTLLFLGLLSLLVISACNLTSLMGEPPAPPSVKITAPTQGGGIVVGDTITISFEATSSTEEMLIPFIELTLNSVNGESVASSGSMSSLGKISPVTGTLTWTAQQAGEYTLYLTAYDAEEKASAPDTLKVTVFARPEEVMSGKITLQNNQSYDILTQVIEYYDGDDPDFVAWNFPEGWSVQNPDMDEITSAHLFSVANEQQKSVTARLYDLKVVRKLYSDALWSYDNADFFMATGELYLYKRFKTPGEFALIQVLELNDESITFEYVLFDMP